MASKFGGISIEEGNQSKFGGVPIADTTSKFGGIPIEATDSQVTSTPDVPEWGQKHPNVYGAAGALWEAGKPTLEAVGLAGGAIVGAGAGNPIGGAGAGYGTVKQLEQLAEEHLGNKPSMDNADRYKQLQQDVMLGEMYQMGGEVVNKAVFEPVIKGGKWVFNYISSALTGKTGKTATKQAAKIWAANTSSGPIYAKNKQEAETLESMIPGIKFTEGQKTYNTKTIKFERSAFRKQGSAGEASVEQIAQNDVALKAYYQKEFGGDEGVDDFLGALNKKYFQMQNDVVAVKKAAGQIETDIDGGDIQKIHQNVVDSLKSNKATNHNKAQNLYSLIPDDVPLNTQTLMDDFRDIAKPLSKVEDPSDIPAILQRALKNYKPAEMPKNLKEMVSVFKKRGQALPKPIEAEVAKYASMDELPLKEIRGIRTGILSDLRKKDVSDVARLRLNRMLDSIEDTVEQLADSGKYGEDVADIYKTASQYWKEYKTTYENGVVGDILAKNRSAGELKLTPEQALGKVFNSKDTRAIDQLNKAIPKNEASTLVKDYADYDLIAKTRNSVTGEVDKTKLAKWLSKNKDVLSKYNLQDSYSNLENIKRSISQMEKSITLFEKSQASKMLNVDAEKAVKVAFTGVGGKATQRTAKQLMELAKDNPAAQAGIKRAFTDNLMNELELVKKTIAGNPSVSNDKFWKLYKQYEPALREFYKAEPRKIQSLKNIKKAYEIMSRNVTSPIGGGSDTFENTAASLYEAIGHFPVGGPLVIRATRSVARVLTSFTDSQVEAVVSRAIFDPEVALTLEMMVMGKPPEFIQKRFTAHILALTGVVAENMDK